MEKILLIFNREPYYETDVTWNGLRLAETLRKKDMKRGFKLTMGFLADWVADSDKVLTF